MKLVHFLTLFTLSVALSGCVHKVVTTTAKIAYKTTKGVVKGTVAVGKAIIPGDGDNKNKKD